MDHSLFKYSFLDKHECGFQFFFFFFFFIVYFYGFPACISGRNSEQRSQDLNINILVNTTKLLSKQTVQTHPSTNSVAASPCLNQPWLSPFPPGLLKL